MRINQYIASRTGLSRRAVDGAIEQGRVSINGAGAVQGQQVKSSDIITIDKQPINHALETHLVMLNKPVGYVSSRTGQRSKTIYDLLPAELHKLKPVGRLDKDSSGLILLTNDGQLANQLTHPSFGKLKVYQVELDNPLSPEDKTVIEKGVKLEDGPSALTLKGQGRKWTVTMSEGRNRQIRRTFEAVGYKVTKLHRIQFGPYDLRNLESGKYKEL